MVRHPGVSLHRPVFSTSVLFALLLALVACGTESVLPTTPDPVTPGVLPPSPPRADLARLGTTVRAYLDHLTALGIDPFDVDRLRAITLDHVAHTQGSDGAAFAAARASFDATAAITDLRPARERAGELASPHLRALVIETDVVLEQASSLDAFAAWARARAQQILEGDFASDEAGMAIAYLVGMGESAAWLDAGGATWIDALGRAQFQLAKCLLGIGGGLLLGGLSGAATGTAVPVIGTLSGGIIGALGGGATGAAVHCF